ncbi:ABC transporter ATP-binding protein [Telmatospirillum siberiense]|uniref:ABC transporter ATP-binding protein n=1 Tax=Telmatospirillum siberiense TaxID=382514 RepID=A0A2N3PUX3_9PROT|nr:ABC transporter ATP-binding protein [Telmatospirillum siberiense]PKU24201.1 ABC transporter ATP-binding protein [Telmatospirillum siberiense]
MPPSSDTGQNAANIRLEGVSHRFGQTDVISDVSLDIADGEFVALLGPSGCGKSTLLRILAGLQEQTIGRVLIGERCVDGLPPRTRGVGIVFQNYALFPHMTALANVAYGLEAVGISRAEALVRARDALAGVQMTPFGERKPRALSGGQQQRVALARTLAIGPRILLLDEPLAALDKNLRLDMQLEIRRLQRALRITTVMVTHDQEEAMGMADRIAVLNAGCVEQFDTPEAIYDRPETLFVANFVGAANMLEAELQGGPEGFRLHLADGTLDLAKPAPASRPGRVQASIRPEHWSVAPADGEGPTATVSIVTPLGPSALVDLVLSDGRPCRFSFPRAQGVHLTPGDQIRLGLQPGAAIRLFV